ncbi:MAG: MFS transporter [Acidobacteria bacterium]|nr:MFS transporter [Acidobacteriota bacterium]
MISRPGSQASKTGAVLTLLFLILFIGVLDNQVILPILSLIAVTFHRSVAELGWVVTAYALGAAVLNLLFGPLSDSFGRKPMLLVGLAAFAISGYLLSLRLTFLEFFVLRVLMGVFAGILSTSVTAYVGDYFPYEVRGRAMGVVMASYFAALIFGVPMGAFIADHWGWRRIFTVTGLLATFLTLTTARILPRGAKISGTRRILAENGSHFRLEPDDWRANRIRRVRRSAAEHFNRYRHYLTSLPRLAALVSAAFVSGATLAVLTFVSPWLMMDFGLSASRVGLIFLMVGTASIIASPLSGWASDHLGKRRLFVISSLAAAVLIALLPWLKNMRLLLILFFGVALVIAFRQTSQQALVTELVPAQGRGSFIALRNCFSQAGIAISVIFASLLFESYGFKGVALFSAVQSVLAACFFFWVAEPAPSGPPFRT